MRVVLQEVGYGPDAKPGKQPRVALAHAFDEPHIRLQARPLSGTSSGLLTLHAFPLRHAAALYWTGMASGNRRLDQHLLTLAVSRTVP